MKKILQKQAIFLLFPGADASHDKTQVAEKKILEIVGMQRTEVQYAEGKALCIDIRQLAESCVAVDPEISVGKGSFRSGLVA